MTQIFSTKMKKMKKIIFFTTDLTDSWRAKRAKDTIITDKKRKPKKLCGNSTRNTPPIF